MDQERHPLDPVSLVFGVIFVVLALLGLTSGLTRLDPAVLGWVVPAALVAIGVGILLGSRGGDRGAGDQLPDGEEPRTR